MQKSQPQAPKSSFGVGDVLFVLFKHKWMILLLSLAGFGAAALVYVKRVPLYQSQAKLLIRYVQDSPNIDEYQSQARPGTGKVDNVMNTQIEIVRSTDVAIQVAEAIGVDRLIPESGGNAPLSAAAGVILSNLHAGVGASNNVLVVNYGNEDPVLAKEVLEQLLVCYNARHLEIHRKGQAYEIVEKDTEAIHKELEETLRELSRLRTEHGIVSLDDALGSISAQEEQARQTLLDIRGRIVEKEANLKAFDVDGADLVVDDPADPAPASAITEYRTVMELLEFHRKQEVELRKKYRSSNPAFARNKTEIDRNEARRKQLETQFPDLAQVAQAIDQDANDPRWNLVREKANLGALKAREAFYEAHLEDLKQQFREKYAIGFRIDELERKRKMEDEAYQSHQAKLKNAEIDLALDPKRMPNIEQLDSPTEPVRTFDEKLNKLILGLAGGGMAIGLGLAFLIELLLDRRVKRPVEIQARLQLPLLLSIPYIRNKNRGGLLLGNDSGAPRIGSSGEMIVRESASEELGFENPLKKTGHFILPYSETIRDRIIFNFEVNNIHHKPKLVAVTGLSDGAGTSTIAAGVAKSFSEIPGMKVLLVDLSSYHPEENPLFGEIPRHSLNGALHLARETEFKDNPQNLYYASATARRDDSGMTTFSPVHLYELMPHLQASEYDYIIFDMPPIDQTSRTLTMAGLMDKVLLVLDAENTSRDGLMWGYSELVKGRADVSCVFNKTRSHVPGWLTGEM